VLGLERSNAIEVVGSEGETDQSGHLDEPHGLTRQLHPVPRMLLPTFSG
jgi:hypothetical protein